MWRTIICLWETNLGIQIRDEQVVYEPNLAKVPLKDEVKNHYIR